MSTPKTSQQKLIHRLSIIEGQIRGLKVIIEDNNCEKAAQQMLATRRALDKAFHEMMSCMIEEKMQEGENSPQSIEEIKLIITKYMK